VATYENLADYVLGPRWPPNSSQPCGCEFRSSSKRADGAKLRISDPKEGIRTGPKGRRYSSRCVGGRDDLPGDSRATFFAIFQVQSVSRAQTKAELRRARRRKPKVQRWNFQRICRINHDDDGTAEDGAIARTQLWRGAMHWSFSLCKRAFHPPYGPTGVGYLTKLSSSAELAKAAQGIPWSSIQFVRGVSQGHWERREIPNYDFWGFCWRRFPHGKNSQDVMDGIESSTVPYPIAQRHKRGNRQ
jgi:hypothetical protein